MLFVFERKNTVQFLIKLPILQRACIYLAAASRSLEALYFFFVFFQGQLAAAASCILSQQAGKAV